MRINNLSIEDILFMLKRVHEHRNYMSEKLLDSIEIGNVELREHYEHEIHSTDEFIGRLIDSIRK